MGWLSILRIGWTLFSRGASGSGLADTASRLADKLVELDKTDSEVKRAEIEREVVQLKAIADLQAPAANDLRSPMRVGQYLIVVPFGFWWASIFIISVLKPVIQDGLWSVDNVPPHILEMAWWLIPLIVGGTILERRK
jgi:hypothetical protein